MHFRHWQFLSFSSAFLKWYHAWAISYHSRFFFISSLARQEQKIHFIIKLAKSDDQNQTRAGIFERNYRHEFKAAKLNSKAGLHLSRYSDRMRLLCVIEYEETVKRQLPYKFLIILLKIRLRRRRGKEKRFLVAIIQNELEKGSKVSWFTNVDFRSAVVFLDRISFALRISDKIRKIRNNFDEIVWLVQTS